MRARRWHSDNVKPGAESLLDYFAGLFWTRLEEFIAGGNGDHAGKVNLLNSQEHRKLGEVFDFDNVAMKQGRAVHLG